MGKIAFVFAGQGAQYGGMGKSIYNCSPAARRAMDEMERLRPGTLRQCFEGDGGPGSADELRETINAQPCLFMMDYACALAVREQGIEPELLAGFSLGEIPAAAFAGMLPLERAFRLVMRRAELMQRAAEKNPGKMAAVLRLSAEQVRDLSAGFDGVYPVNFNCPGQTVVAAKEESFEPFRAEVVRMGGRTMPLNVSGAFHSPFMDEARDGLMAYLAGVELAAPELPLYANLDAEPYHGDLRATLANQLNHPVLWQRTIENMLGAGATAFVEVGAGATLCGLIRKIDPSAFALNVQDQDGLSALLRARAEGKL